MHCSLYFRAATAMCGYDEARKKGEKHSVAVAEAVDLVREVLPEMPISETEVKRVLAFWRPRGCSTILFFERASVSEEDENRHRLLLEQLASLEKERGLKFQIPPNRKLTVRIIARIAERPTYPRHNRKIV